MRYFSKVYIILNNAWDALLKKKVSGGMIVIWGSRRGPKMNLLVQKRAL
jgi:hypothetical protein